MSEVERSKLREDYIYEIPFHCQYIFDKIVFLQNLSERYRMKFLNSIKRQKEEQSPLVRYNQKDYATPTSIKEDILDLEASPSSLYVRYYTYLAVESDQTSTPPSVSNRMTKVQPRKKWPGSQYTTEKVSE